MKIIEEKIEDASDIAHEEILKSEGLQSLEGGVYSSVEQSSTGISGVITCCYDVITSSQSEL